MRGDGKVDGDLQALFRDGLTERVAAGSFPTWQGNTNVHQPLAVLEGRGALIMGMAGKRLCWASRAGYFETALCKAEMVCLPPVHRGTTVTVEAGGTVSAQTVADHLLAQIDQLVQGCARAGGYRREGRLPAEAVGATFGPVQTQWVDVNPIDVDADDAQSKTWKSFRAMVAVLVLTPTKEQPG